MDTTFQSKDLFVVLRRQLRTRKISYRQLAESVSFSEGTVKNIFHNYNCSLERLLEICDAVGIDFAELVDMASRERATEFSLTWEQEEVFAASPHLYYFFREHFFEKMDLKAIQKKYNLTEKSITKYLLELEKLGILDLYPDNKVKYKVRGRQMWIDGGPWMQAFAGTYTTRMAEIVVDPKRNHNAYSSRLGFFRLSPHAYEAFKKEVDELGKKYKEIAYLNYMVGRDAEAIPVSWIFNIVPCDLYHMDTEIPNIVDD